MQEIIEITDSSELTEDIDNNFSDTAYTVENADTESETQEIESKEDEKEVESSDNDEAESSDSEQTATSDMGENDTGVGNESSVISSFDYTETLQYIAEQQVITNELLVRINNQNDFIIALAVTFIICMVCYKILHGFTKV